MTSSFSFTENVQLIAAVYRYKSECTKSFAVTLVLMPVIVQMVIMLVNGNLGTGVP